MSEPINKRAIGVGVFIILGLLLLLGGVLTIGNLHSTFQKKMTVSTIFGNVGGLQSGNNIWFSGVKIGTVKKIEFYGLSQVKVILNINKESKQFIRKNAKVKISTDGLIGNKILVIYGGTAEYAEVEEGDTLVNEVQLSTEEMMNTFQQSNLNILALTNKLVNGEGTVGKLLTNDDVYRSLDATTHSLNRASLDAERLIGSLASFSAKLNKSGSFANDLVTDTVLFNSMKNSVIELKQIMDTVNVFVSNLKEAGSNPKSPVGVLIHDETAGANLKATIANLESSSVKLDKNLEAMQHSFPLKRYFKKQARKNKK